MSDVCSVTKQGTYTVMHYVNYCNTVCIFVDEAGFNLAKTQRRGRNVIGQRATVDVPGQRGDNCMEVEGL